MSHMNTHTYTVVVILDYFFSKGLKRIVKAAVSSQTAEYSPIAVFTCEMLQNLRTFSTSEDH